VTLLLSRIYSWGRWGRVFVVVYLMAVTGLFVYRYPLLTGIEVSRQYFYQHMWFPSWI
jgi:dolichyl-phosphate-mannose--protein O-mannosyl transferase